MLNRNITSELQKALKDTPVILIHGARQTGKSTLAKYLINKIHKSRYITFDDTETLGSALNDPSGFISDLKGSTVIDEVQKAPEIFSAIKLSVDNDRKPGKFILTGSADALLIPQLSDKLVGRMQILTLFPFSIGEKLGIKESFIDNIFSNKPIEYFNIISDKNEILNSVISGGFPEIIHRKQIDRKIEWFQSYINTILQRDIKDISNIQGLVELPRLLSLLAARTSSLFNLSEISRSILLPQTTLNRYIAYLNAVYLIKFIPAYTLNFGKRLVKSPKIIFVDTGLASHLLSIFDVKALNESNLKGKLIENFVITELIKQISWSRTNPQIYHYRTLKGKEVDIILERGLKIVGIEIKSNATVGVNDFKGLKQLAEDYKDTFHRGIILYTGQNILSFAKNLYAMPIESLWKLGAIRN